MNTSDIGTTLSRITLGIVLVAHSAYVKLVVFGLPGTAGYFQSIGLPRSLAYITFAVELVTGVALIIGYRTRLAALIVLPFMLGATWAHWQNGWLFINDGGGWEYPLLLAVLAVVHALQGQESEVVDRAVDIPAVRQHQ